MVMGVGMDQIAGSAAPTSAAERIFALDVIRGFAVLGILLMNILGFGMPSGAYMNAIAIEGGNTGWNLWAWYGEMFYFEGTMRGLFTVLFGAGIVLYTSRLERAGVGVRSADLYFRRNIWLWIFGIFNAYVLLWDGDILFFYGLSALFLYVFRNLPVHKLLLWSALLLSIQPVVGVGDYLAVRDAEAQAPALLAKQKAKQELSPAEQDALDTYTGAKYAIDPDPKKVAQAVEKMQGSYFSAAERVHEHAWSAETEYLPRQGLWECIGMMLLGMALFKSGALTLGWSTRAYTTMLLLGYGIGLSVNAWEIHYVVSNHFGVSAAMLPWTLTYDLGRIPTTLGHVAVAMLVVRSGLFRGVLKAFSATGQMALTNYLAQSTICLFLFTGAGLGWFGQLQRYQLYYVVMSIWLVELIWSPLWLAHFRFGPMEWLWRSLTRWEKQPMRLAHGVGSAVQMEDAATP
jgi:uncharacterized protein